MLDVGCGTGDNALHLASLGLSVLGVDVAETALAIARRKAEDRGLQVEFVAADAYHLDRLGRRFQTVLDVGMFHTCDADERPAYVASLASVTEPAPPSPPVLQRRGSRHRPAPVRRDDLAAAFAPSTGWQVVTIDPTRVHTRFHGDDGAPAWLARIRRRADQQGSASLARLARPALRADVPDGRRQDGEDEEREEQAAGHGQEPPRCAPRPDRDDLHDDRADDRTADQAVHERPRAHRLAVREGADLEAQRPEAVVGDEQGQQRAR